MDASPHKIAANKNIEEAADKPSDSVTDIPVQEPGAGPGAKKLPPLEQERVEEPAEEEGPAGRREEPPRVRPIANGEAWSMGPMALFSRRTRPAPWDLVGQARELRYSLEAAVQQRREAAKRQRLARQAAEAAAREIAVERAALAAERAAGMAAAPVTPPATSQRFPPQPYAPSVPSHQAGTAAPEQRPTAAPEQRPIVSRVAPTAPAAIDQGDSSPVSAAIRPAAAPRGPSRPAAWSRSFIAMSRAIATRSTRGASRLGVRCKSAFKIVVAFPLQLGAGCMAQGARLRMLVRRTSDGLKNLARVMADVVRAVMKGMMALLALARSLSVRAAAAFSQLLARAWRLPVRAAAALGQLLVLAWRLPARAGTGLGHLLARASRLCVRAWAALGQLLARAWQLSLRLSARAAAALGQLLVLTWRLSARAAAALGRLLALAARLSVRAGAVLGHLLARASRLCVRTGAALGQLLVRAWQLFDRAGAALGSVLVRAGVLLRHRFRRSARRTRVTLARAVLSVGAHAPRTGELILAPEPDARLGEARPRRSRLATRGNSWRSFRTVSVVALVAIGVMGFLALRDAPQPWKAQAVVAGVAAPGRAAAVVQASNQMTGAAESAVTISPHPDGVAITPAETAPAAAAEKEQRAMMATLDALPGTAPSEKANGTTNGFAPAVETHASSRLVWSSNAPARKASPRPANMRIASTPKNPPAPAVAVNTTRSKPAAVAFVSAASATASARKVRTGENAHRTRPLTLAEATGAAGCANGLAGLICREIERVIWCGKMQWGKHPECIVDQPVTLVQP